MYEHDHMLYHPDSKFMLLMCCIFHHYMYMYTRPGLHVNSTSISNLLIWCILLPNLYLLELSWHKWKLPFQYFRRKYCKDIIIHPLISLQIFPNRIYVFKCKHFLVIILPCILRVFKCLLGMSLKDISYRFTLFFLLSHPFVFENYFQCF